jgi:hypothetical protein
MPDWGFSIFYGSLGLFACLLWTAAAGPAQFQYPLWIVRSFLLAPHHRIKNHVTSFSILYGSFVLFAPKIPPPPTDHSEWIREACDNSCAARLGGEGSKGEPLVNPDLADFHNRTSQDRPALQTGRHSFVNKIV